MKKKLVIIWAILTPVLAFGLFFVWSEGPSTADIKQKQTNVKGALTINSPTKIATYEHMTVHIPDRFVSKTKTEGLGSPIYTQQLFTVPAKDLQSIFSDQLAITIGVLPGAGLPDLADVRLRNRDSSYILVKETEQALIFEKTTTSNYEIGAFIKNESIYTSLVFSGPQNNQATLKKELNDSIASVIW